MKNESIEMNKLHELVILFSHFYKTSKYILLWFGNPLYRIFSSLNFNKTKICFIVVNAAETNNFQTFD